MGTEVLFGESSNILLPNATEVARRFSWAFDTSLAGVATRMRMAKAARFYHDSQYLPACRYVHEYIEKVLDKAMKVELKQQEDRQATRKASQNERDKSDEGDEEAYSLLKQLIRGGVDRVDIRYQILNICES